MEQAREAGIMKKEAQDAVADAQKTLEKAIEEVKSLKKDHLVEIRSFAKPPVPVIWTLAGVVVLLGEKPNLKKMDDSDKKTEDYFGCAKEKLLSDPNALLNRLLENAASDWKDNIPQVNIQKFEKNIKDEPGF